MGNAGSARTAFSPSGTTRPSTPFEPSTPSTAAYLDWRECERATNRGRARGTIEPHCGWRELLAEAVGVKPNGPSSTTA